MFLRKTANYWVPFLIILFMVEMTFLNVRIDQATDMEDHFASRWTAAGSWMKEGWSPYSEETRLATDELIESTGDRPGERSKGQF